MENSSGWGGHSESDRERQRVAGKKGQEEKLNDEKMVIDFSDGFARCNIFLVCAFLYVDSPAVSAVILFAGFTDIANKKIVRNLIVLD